MDNVGKLYEIYDVLADPQNDALAHESKYLEIIHAVKGTNNEKTLASQFIVSFAKKFPHLEGTAVDALLDLAEDEDITIRRNAVKALVKICQEAKSSITKVADIFTQMLQTEDAAELNMVQNALMSLFKIDFKMTFDSVLSQFSATDEEVIRKQAAEFLSTKLKTLDTGLFSKEIEEFMLEKYVSAFANLNFEDILSLLPLIANLKISRMVSVQKTIVNIISLGACSKDEFLVNDANIEKFIRGIHIAQPYFNAYVSSSPFFSYMCSSILPKLDEIRASEKGPEKAYRLLKAAAEISLDIDKECGSECIESIHGAVVESIPLPDTDSEASTEQNLQFTHIECLLFIFIGVLKHNPDFLVSEDNSERYKDIKARLQNLDRQLRNAEKKSKDQPGDGDFKESVCNNLHSLIKVLFNGGAQFKTPVVVSWKVKTSKIPVKPGIKRSFPPTFDDSKSNGKARKVIKLREIYSPPIGKYSKNA